MELTCHRLTPAIGATATLPHELGDVSEEVADLIHSALVEHSVLVFPDADLDTSRMVQLGRALGTLGVRHHSYKTHPDSEDVVVLTWEGDQKPDAAEWHSDMTYRRQPPFASILKAVEVPPVGGDTLWASMFAVHDALDPGLRNDLAQLEAVHDMGAFRTGAYRVGGDQGITTALAEAGTAVHPVIAHHPVTGRPYVNVSESFARFVIGLSAPESARLLTFLFDLINRPDFHVRIRWQPGMVVIWDNRGTQHYAVADYLPHRRVMHRVAVVTDRRTPADPNPQPTDERHDAERPEHHLSGSAGLGAVRSWRAALAHLAPGLRRRRRSTLAATVGTKNPRRRSRPPRFEMERARRTDLPFPRSRRRAF